jgi:serine/threonine-protein kinase
MGTPRYMSPEQLRGDEVDARTDVWSLAVIAFRLLTGSHPFPGEELVDVVQRIVGCEAVPATAFNGLLPAQLDGFFERALAKERNMRFASAQELANALAEIAEVPTTSGFSLPPASGRPAETASTLRLEAAPSRRGWLALGGSLLIALISGTIALRPTSTAAAVHMPIPAIEVPSVSASVIPTPAPSESVKSVVPAPVRSPPKPAAPAKSGDDLFDSVF